MADREARGPLRVLHVSQPNGGGVAVYVGQAAGDQRRRGWEVAVACPRGGDLPERCAAAGVPWFPWDARRAPGPRTLLEARSLRRLVATFAPDVVHLHSAKAGLAGRLPRRPRGSPTIFQPHGWSWLAATGRQETASRLWERLAARWTDALVCVGIGELQEGMRAGVRGEYRVVRNGVDRRRFRPADGAARLAARARLGLPATVPLAVCVGRLTRQKGQDVLLAAWPEVTARCPSARLAVVGDGEDLDALRGERVAGVSSSRPSTIRATGSRRRTSSCCRRGGRGCRSPRWRRSPPDAPRRDGRPGHHRAAPARPRRPRSRRGPRRARRGGGRAAAVPGTAEREGLAAASAAEAYDVSGTVALLAAVTRDVAGVGGVPDEPTAGTRAVAGGSGHPGLAGVGAGAFQAGDGAGTNGPDGDGGGAVTPPNSSR